MSIKMPRQNKMTLGIVLVLGIFAYFTPGVQSYGTGAPFSTCLTRYPKHSKTMTQTVQSPFTISLQPPEYKAGDTISVRISSAQQTPFVGFQLAGFREDNPLEAVGQFTTIPEDKAQSFSCRVTYQNMVTHKNKNPITDIQFEWTAPSYNAGNIIFKATLVQNYYIFWTNLESSLTSIEPSILKAPAYTHIPTSEIVGNVNLSGCGDNKACFLYPRQCDDNDCVAAVSFEYLETTGHYQVEMYVDGGSSPGYVGLAFSDDENMGGDETFICAVSDTEMSVQYGFNPAFYNQRLLTDYVQDAQVKRVDGGISCRFMMNPNSTVQLVNHKTNTNATSAAYTYIDFLKDDSWYIQLAWGPIMADSNVVTIHKEMPTQTLSKVHIREAGVYRGSAFHVLVHVHAAVMIVAWTFLSGIATVVARHYRDMLPKTRLLDTKIWFQLHRCIAVLIMILTGIGFTVIFVHYKTPIREAAKPHAYWGIAVATCLGVQVLAGILRPDHDHKFRTIFNWGHRFLGHATHAIAVVTMFLAFDIDYINEDMHKFGFITLSVWLGVQVMWHIFFEAVSCCLKRNGGDSYSFDDNGSDKAGSWLPAILLVVYILFLAGCCAACLCAFLFY